MRHFAFEKANQSMVNIGQVGERSFSQRVPWIKESCVLKLNGAAYTKIVAHAAKYPWEDVSGLILGPKGKQSRHVRGVS